MIGDERMLESLPLRYLLRALILGEWYNFANHELLFDPWLRIRSSPRGGNEQTTGSGSLPSGSRICVAEGCSCVTDFDWLYYLEMKSCTAAAPVDRTCALRRLSFNITFGRLKLDFFWGSARLLQLVHGSNLMGLRWSWLQCEVRA